MTFSDRLAATLSALSISDDATVAFNDPFATSSSELQVLLARLTEGGHYEALMGVIAKYRLSEWWSDGAAIQAMIGLLCNDHDDAAITLLADKEMPPPDASACFATAEELCRGGNHAIAERWLNVLVTRWPDDLRITLMRGAISHAQGYCKEAITHFEQLLSLTPDNLAAKIALVDCYSRTGKRRKATLLLQDCLRIASTDPAQWTNLLGATGSLLLWPAMLWLCKSAANTSSPNLFVLYSKAQALLNAGLFRACRSLFVSSDLPITLQLGLESQCRHWENNFAGELDSLNIILTSEPDHAIAHYNRAHAFGLLNRWEEAFTEWEWRVTQTGQQQTRASFAHLPVWDGKPTTETLVLYIEQGWGDIIQFLRYLPSLQTRVGGIVFDLDPALGSLLGALVDTASDSDANLENMASAAEPSLRLPMMSLPLMLGQTQPSGAPYLKIAPDVIARTTLPEDTGGLQVGLVWSGARAHAADHFRSLHFLSLLPLLEIEGITFHILQKGEALSQVSYAPEGAQIRRTDERVENLADLAGTLLHLDLLISVDSMPIHLAGALGVPVWTLLPYTPDWRWGGDAMQSTTPWYDSMRLFRQTRKGDWHTVIANVAGALHQMVGTQKTTLSPANTKYSPATLTLTDGNRPLPGASLAAYHALLVRDDRHIGAMLALAQAHLLQGELIDSLMWASEATHFACDNLAAWRTLHATMAALDIPELPFVAEHIAMLTAAGSPEDWFGWRYESV